MIDAIVEFMTTYHSGRRGAYGWMYVLAIVATISGALAARELQARKGRVLAKARTGVASGSMGAVALVEQDDGFRRIEGRLYCTEGSYKLSLCETMDERQTVAVHSFTSIEKLENFLETNTVLRLGDFKAG